MKTLISLFIITVLLFIGAYLVVFFSPLFKRSKRIIYKVITLLVLASLIVYGFGVINFLIHYF